MLRFRCTSLYVYENANTGFTCINTKDTTSILDVNLQNKILLSTDEKNMVGSALHATQALRDHCA